MQRRGSDFTDAPSMRISPSSKLSTPTAQRMAVVLPAPLWPMKPYISPGLTVSERPSTAFTPPA